MTRVLVCDDNAVVRGGLRALLDVVDDIDVVGEAGTGREAIDEWARLRPDVVLLDVRMPVMDGVSAATELAPQVPVLMLTYSDEPEIITAAIRAGARGYLVHGEFTPDELARAIRDVAGGGSVVSSRATTVLFDALRSAPARRPRDTFDLTEREREVMELIVAGHANRDIAETLVVSYKTVKNHVNRIFAKLGVGSRTEAVATWLGLQDGPRS
jgi:DNA-binding NarL/FixJ family response regulator